MIRAAAALMAALMCAPLASLAQTSVWGADKGLFRDPAQAKPEEIKLGWHKNYKVGLNFAMSSSQDVVGQTDGTSQTYGLNFKSVANRFSETSEWRNELTYMGATTSTPNVPRFVKSNDELKFATIYLHNMSANPAYGPYVRGEALAPVFVGEDVRSAPVTYRVNRQDGSSTPVFGDSLRLTDGLRPLTTKEAVGMFYRPVQRDNLKIETRAGAAGLQIASNGQFAVGGANAQGEIQVNELDDVNQAGLEAGLLIKGKLDDRSSYELTAEALTPFVNNKRSGDDRDPLRLTNFDALAKFTSKITSWASISYDYRMRLQPQLVDRAQQVHMFVLNITYPTEAEAP